MSKPLAVAQFERTVYNRCNGCGEQRDVHQLRVALTYLAFETIWELCSTCLRDFRNEVEDAAYHAGAVIGRQRVD